jgi:hypothetical protein
LAAINAAYPAYLPEAAVMMERGYQRSNPWVDVATFRNNADSRIAGLAAVAVALASEGRDDDVVAAVMDDWSKRYRLPKTLLRSAQELIRENPRMLAVALEWPPHLETMAHKSFRTGAMMLAPFGYVDEYRARAMSWASANQGKYGDRAYSICGLPASTSTQDDNLARAREAMRFGPSNFARYWLHQERKKALHDPEQIESMLKKMEAMPDLPGEIWWNHE